MEFTVPKSFDDIIEGVVLEAGTYDLLMKEPAKMKPNKAQTGNNILIELVVVNEGEGQGDGVGFTEYLSLPNPSDEGRKIKNGQPMTDFKMDMIRQKVESLGGTVTDNSFDIPDMATCKGQVVKTWMEESGRFRNELTAIMPSE